MGRKEKIEDVAPVSAVQHERSPRAYGKKTSSSYLSDLNAGRQVNQR